MAAFNLGVAEAVSCRRSVIDPYHVSDGRALGWRGWRGEAMMC